MSIKGLIEYFQDYLDSGMDEYDEACYLNKEEVEVIVRALEQTRWIPVSERLPEEREWYLAVFKEKDTGFQLIPRVADYIGQGENKWRIIDEDSISKGYLDSLECVAWMPLSEPYIESEDSNDK